MVDLLLHKAVLAYQQQKLLPTRHLRIAYMLPHHNITGVPCSLNKRYPASHQLVLGALVATSMLADGRAADA